MVGAPSLSLSLKQILVKLCQSVLKLTIGERCSIFLFNEETHTLEPIMSLMSQGLRIQSCGRSFAPQPGSRYPRFWASARRLRPRNLSSRRTRRVHALIPSFWTKTFGLKSLALYPLVHREKTVGVLEVDSFTKFVHFPAEEIETLAAIAKQAAILAAVAKQAAVIIENAHLFEQEQQQRQRAEALVEGANSHRLHPESEGGADQALRGGGQYQRRRPLQHLPDGQRTSPFGARHVLGRLG